MCTTEYYHFNHCKVVVTKDLLPLPFLRGYYFKKGKIQWSWFFEDNLSRLTYKAEPGHFDYVSARDGGCWFCHRKNDVHKLEPLCFSYEADSFFHFSCLEMSLRNACNPFDRFDIAEDRWFAEEYNVPMPSLLTRSIRWLIAKVVK